MGRAVRRRGRGAGLGPVEDVQAAALIYAAVACDPARGADLRRALGRVRPGLSPRLDTVIERAGAALARPDDDVARQALYRAARELTGVRIAPGQEKWWDR